MKNSYYWWSQRGAVPSWGHSISIFHPLTCTQNIHKEKKSPHLKTKRRNSEKEKWLSCAKKQIWCCKRRFCAQFLPGKDLMLHHFQAADAVSSVIENLNGPKIPRPGVPAPNSAIYWAFKKSKSKKNHTMCLLPTVISQQKKMSSRKKEQVNYIFCHLSW